MKVAAVDIGTNTVRLLVARRHEDGALAPLARTSVVTRLGEGVDATGRLHPAAVERALSVLADYGRIIDEAEVDAAGAVATSAVRDAADRDAFLDAAAGSLGFRPRLITGTEEARLTFLGAVAGLPGEHPILVIDPGGGSTEFVMGGAEPFWAVSAETGSVRLTERKLSRQPAPPEDLAAARSDVDIALSGVVLPLRPATTIAVGGTFTSLAAIVLGLPAYDPAAVHRSVLARSALAAQVDRLAAMSVPEIAALPSLDPARAPVLLGGAVVAERSLARAGVAQALVSEADILDGVALTV